MAFLVIYLFLYLFKKIGGFFQFVSTSESIRQDDWSNSSGRLEQLVRRSKRIRPDELTKIFVKKHKKAPSAETLEAFKHPKDAQQKRATSWLF